MKISCLITEKDFQHTVVEAAKLYGWIHYHTYLSKRSPSGFPDLVLVRDRVLFRELKTDKGKLSPHQKLWGVKLTDAGADWAIWRPAQLQAIYSELRGGK